MKRDKLIVEGKKDSVGQATKLLQAINKGEEEEEDSENNEILEEGNDTDSTKSQNSIQIIA